MMDLAELRINRTPVTPNSKCESCVHYDGNAQAKGGVCDVGTAPALCGSGADRKYGYAPLDELGPDEVDDLATPCLHGTVGAMNEHGDIEPMIQMKQVVLGDEDLSMARRIFGDMVNVAQKSIVGYGQGQVSAFSNAELGSYRRSFPSNVIVDVAKALHDSYFAPRKRHKFGVTDVLAYLQSCGMPVTDDDMTVCKSRFGPTRPVPVGHIDNPTLPQAAAHVRAHSQVNATYGATGSNPHPVLGKDAAPHVPNVTPLRPPRNRTPTQPMPVHSQPMAVAKSVPDVNLLRKSDGPLHNYKVGDKVMHDGVQKIVNRAHPTNPYVGVKLGNKPGRMVPHDELTPITKSMVPNVKPLKVGDGHFVEPFTKSLVSGEGSRGGKVIGHTKSGKPVYAPSDDAIAHMREHVNLQKRTAEGKLAEHARRHLAHTSTGYSAEEHSDAAEHHGKEAMNYNNSDKVRALHRHIADAHKAKSRGELTPAGQADKEAADRAKKRDEAAKKKEAKREKTTIATTPSGHEIKNTHHIRYGGFGPELKEGPKSLSSKDPRWQPVETELGEHLTHEQHKEIADYHRGRASQHAERYKEHTIAHSKERASGKYDSNVNNLEQAAYHRNSHMNHLHAAKLHDDEAAKKPSEQHRQENAGQLAMFKSTPSVRLLRK